VSSRIIAVSNALKARIVDLGIAPAKVHVLRNGVDLDLFRPSDRGAARAALGLDARRWLASVGNLVPEKGHALMLDALRLLPDVGLVIVGSGVEENALRARARADHVSERVRFVGEVPQDRLPQIYAAVDALVLASSREGWPNVLLESMACGTPVVATRVGAVPDIVTSSAAGRIVDEATAPALSVAIRDLLQRRPMMEATRAVAERFGWEETTRRQIDIFQRVIDEGSADDGMGSDYSLSGSAGCGAI
jgi:glycosyltransferase involved in cell wall biosynthesis